MIGKSQSTRQDSKTLLNKLVFDTTLRSSIDSGGEHLGIGTPNSVFHYLGYILVFKIELKITVAGAANSTENSFMIFG